MSDEKFAHLKPGDDVGVARWGWGGCKEATIHIVQNVTRVGGGRIHVAGDAYRLDGSYKGPKKAMCGYLVPAEEARELIERKKQREIEDNRRAVRRFAANRDRDDDAMALIVRVLDGLLESDAECPMRAAEDAEELAAILRERAHELESGIEKRIKREAKAREREATKNFRL